MAHLRRSHRFCFSFSPLAHPGASPCCFVQVPARTKTERGCGSLRNRFFRNLVWFRLRRVRLAPRERREPLTPEFHGKSIKSLDAGSATKPSNYVMLSIERDTPGRDLASVVVADSLECQPLEHVITGFRASSSVHSAISCCAAPRRWADTWMSVPTAGTSVPRTPNNDPLFPTSPYFFMVVEVAPGLVRGWISWRSAPRFRSL